MSAGVLSAGSIRCRWQFDVPYQRRSLWHCNCGCSCHRLPKRRVCRELHDVEARLKLVRNGDQQIRPIRSISERTCGNGAAWSENLNFRTFRIHWRGKGETDVVVEIDIVMHIGGRVDACICHRGEAEKCRNGDCMCKPIHNRLRFRSCGDNSRRCYPFRALQDYEVPSWNRPAGVIVESKGYKFCSLYVLFLLLVLKRQVAT